MEPILFHFKNLSLSGKLIGRSCRIYIGCLFAADARQHISTNDLNGYSHLILYRLAVVPPCMHPLRWGGAALLTYQCQIAEGLMRVIISVDFVPTHTQYYEIY